MLPPQRRQILQQCVVQRRAVATQSTGGTLQIYRVPQHDGRRHQIEAAGPVALLLKTAVADFTQSVEEDRPGQRVARLALIQPRMDAAAQLHALQPIQNEQRALDAPQLAQRHGQAVLARVAAEFLDMQNAVFNRPARDRACASGTAKLAQPHVEASLPVCQPFLRPQWHSETTAFRDGLCRNECVFQIAIAPGPSKPDISGAERMALSQILQVNSMLTMGREVAAPDIAERADDFEYHCRKAEAPVEG